MKDEIILNILVLLIFIGGILGVIYGKNTPIYKAIFEDNINISNTSKDPLPLCLKPIYDNRTNTYLCNIDDIVVKD